MKTLRPSLNLRRTFLTGFALLASMTCMVALAQTEKVTPKKLTPEELKQMIETKQKFFFLDVREPKELEEVGTIKGYVNIPLGQLEARINEIPKNVSIVSACAHAVRAAKAAVILEKHGYKQISLCALAEYKEKGYEMIHPKAQ